MDNCDKRWRKYNKKLDKIKLNGLNFLTHPVIKKTITSPYDKNELYCDKKLKIINDEFGLEDGLSYLEVGAGYGNFCRMLHKRIKVGSYTILDSPSMARISKHFLEYNRLDHVKWIYSNNFKDVFTEKYDMFFSFECLTELPKDYLEELVDNVFPNCNGIFIIDGYGEKEFIGEILFKDWLIRKIQDNFGVCYTIPFKGYWKQHCCYIGRNI